MDTTRSACPFCDHEAIGTQLIAEGGPFLVLADLYPLVEGHLLLVPREHLACYGALPPSQLPELRQLKERISSFLSSSYGVPIFFEHGIAGQTVAHAHLHAVPSLPSLLPVISTGREVAPAPGLEAVCAWFRSRGPYLYYEEGESGLLLEPGVIPPGYLEQVAMDLLPRRPERLDGRTVAIDVRARWQQRGD